MRIPTWLLALAIALLAVSSATATPILGAGAFTPFGVNPDNSPPPFWDHPSADGASCNVGYFLAGGFTGCGNLKNGTPPSGLGLGAGNLEYYSGAGGAVVAFTLAPGEWTFTLQGRIAGSPTFEVGYYVPLLPALSPMFNQTNTVGDTFVLKNTGPVGLYIWDVTPDPDSFFTSEGPVGVAAFGYIPDNELFYFGFEDRPDGDFDYNDVVLGAKYVPEPGTYALIGLGLAALGVLRRRKA